MTQEISRKLFDLMNILGWNDKGGMSAIEHFMFYSTQIQCSIIQCSVLIQHD